MRLLCELVLVSLGALTGCHDSAEPPAPGSATSSVTAAEPAVVSLDALIGTPVTTSELARFGVAPRLAVIGPPGITSAELAQKLRAAAPPEISVEPQTARDLGLSAAAVRELAQDIPALDLPVIAAAQAIVMLSARTPGAASVHALAIPAARVAADVHGWLYDVAVGRLVTAAWFADHLPQQDNVRTMITIPHVSDRDTPLFVTTFGMRALGLPDLLVMRATESQLVPLTIMVAAAAQQLLLHPAVSRPGELDVDFRALDASWFGAQLQAHDGTARTTWRARWAPNPLPGLPPVIALEPMAGTRSEDVSAVVSRTMGSTRVSE